MCKQTSCEFGTTEFKYNPREVLITIQQDREHLVNDDSLPYPIFGVELSFQNKK